MILFQLCLALLSKEMAEEIDVQIPVEIVQIGEDGFPIIIR
jgi:hypothetical protein